MLGYWKIKKFPLPIPGINFLGALFHCCGLSSLPKLLSKEFTKLKTKLKTKAHQNPSTEKPDIKLSAMRITTAFITNRKSPKVKIVAGIVKRIKSGFIVIFSRAKTMATKIAVPNPSRWTALPIIQAVIKTLSVFTTNLISRLFMDS